MEYACSLCKHTSRNKQDIIKHLGKKKSCGSGIKEIIEIPAEYYKCQFCSGDFSTKFNLNYHVKNNCKKKNEIKDDKIKQLEEEIKQLKDKPSIVFNIIDNSNTTNIFVVVNYL